MKLYLNLNTLNNQNEELWHSFINLTIDSTNCTLILNNNECGTEFMDSNNYPYTSEKEADTFDFKVIYPDDFTELNKANKNILLIDERNKNLIYDYNHSGEFYIASKNTFNELKLPKCDNLVSYILLNEYKICFKDNNRSEYVVISDQDTPIVHAFNHCFKNKLSTSDIKNDPNHIKGRSNKTIIYNGNEPSHIHGFINSKDNYSISNINKSIFISTTRIAFDFNQFLYQIICNVDKNRESNLREYINQTLKETKTPKETNFLNLNQQLNEDFQILIRNINQIEELQYLPIDAIYLIPLKISIYNYRKHNFEKTLDDIYHHLFRLIENSKYDINFTFQILLILFRFNQPLLFKYSEIFIEKTKDKTNSVITSNHIFWFLSVLSSINHDFDCMNSNSVLMPYLRSVDLLTSGDSSELCNFNNADLYKLLNLVYSMYIFNFNIVHRINIELMLDSSFLKFKHEPIFRKFKLLLELAEHKITEFNDFQPSLYGGIVSLRNLHYQYIFKNLNEGIDSVDSNTFSFIQNYSTDSSFDNLFQFLMLSVFNNSEGTSDISGINLKENPWLENNTFICLLFHYYIFSFFNNIHGLKIIKSIANILKFKLNKTPKYTAKYDINNDGILDTLLDFCNEYYSIIK